MQLLPTVPWVAVVLMSGGVVAAGAARAEPFGRFLDDAVAAKWGPDGRTMELLADFRFQAPDGEIWIAREGSKIDGASIPQPFWSMIGGPFEGRYRDASVIHDYYCDHHLKTWQATALVFYQGMRARGVSEPKALTMYYAVYAFGPHWQTELTHRVSSSITDGVTVQTTATTELTRIDTVAVSAREVDLAKSLEARLEKGEALSLADIARIADDDRRSAQKLPVRTETKTTTSKSTPDVEIK